MDMESVNSGNEANDENRPTYCKLIDELDKEKLEKLRGIFKAKSSESTYTDYGLNEEEFLNAVNEVFGDDFLPVEEIITLFESIDKQEENIMRWNHFLDFLTNTLKQEPTAFLRLGQVEYASPPHVKRDTIVKIVLIETEKYFCYAVVSKYGHVGLYGGHFDFLTSYSVIMAREDIHRNDEERRRRNRWITDGIFLADILMLVIVNTSRNMIIYDASGLKHIPIWLILGFPDIIQELVNEKEFVVIQKYGRVHTEAVNAVDYFPNSQTIISCSRDPNRSVIIKAIDTREAPIIFKMRQGTNCFCLRHQLQLLITGSEDGTILVWNILVPSKALSVLNEHKCGVVDIIIIEHLNVFISCSRDGVLLVWNLKEYFCLQTVDLKFPFFEISGKDIEWGTKSIFPGPKRYEDETTLLELSKQRSE